jgi:hypothetical protein
LLALESSDEGGFVIIVDSSNFDTSGELTCAAFAGDGCDGVFSGFQELFGKVLANVASSLEVIVNKKSSGYRF